MTRLNPHRPAGDRRLRFVDEYLVDMKATQVAIRAEYSEKTTKAQGSRLLTFVDVRRAIEAKQEERAHKAVAAYGIAWTRTLPSREEDLQ